MPRSVLPTVTKHAYSLDLWHKCPLRATVCKDWPTEKLWDYSQRWEMSALSVNYQGYLMAYKCVPVAVGLVKAHVAMSAVSLPVGMNECPPDSFLHDVALSGLPGVTKFAFLKSMTGNMCKKFIICLPELVFSHDCSGLPHHFLQTR